MARPPHDPPRPITVTSYGSRASELRRVARLLPGLNPHGVALRAIERGLPLVEAELRDAARAISSEDS